MHQTVNLEISSLSETDELETAERHSSSDGGTEERK